MSTVEGLTTITVPVAVVHPNAYNPNKMSERVYNAERESIREYGFIDPITCRAHPDLEGEYEIIDGEHRLSAAVEEGITDVPIVVLDVTEAEAQKLTVILNETRGEADVALLGKLLAGLRSSFDENSLRIGLPYTDDELAHLTEIGQIDWDNFQTQTLGNRDSDDGLHTVTLGFTQEEYERYTTTVAALGHEWGLDSPARIVLQALADGVQATRKK